ncbi:hypothetical protein GX50_02943 [[Emmonsia] crescens]|uniref:Uncharacterized protein n=1 Tax=[Emmonsia] crescens TaxID=73230 RepID=A0A2B7ZJX0_9EURO|nr:hypothetical protein GX50_02943 [Emmonsia crescens]
MATRYTHRQPTTDHRLNKSLNEILEILGCPLWHCSHPAPAAPMILLIALSTSTWADLKRLDSNSSLRHAGSEWLRRAEKHPSFYSTTTECRGDGGDGTPLEDQKK